MSDKATILYIDDEEINIFLFQRNFRSYFEIVTAHTGQEGLQKLREHASIRAVISDMRMPGMSGVEFVQEAKREFPEKPYFILTAFNAHDEIDEAMKAGLITATFAKPFDVPTIVEVLHAHTK